MKSHLYINVQLYKKIYKSTWKYEDCRRVIENWIGYKKYSKLF